MQKKLRLLFNIEAQEGRLVLLMLAYSFFAGLSRLVVNTTAGVLFRDRFGPDAAQLLPYVYIGAAIVASLTGFFYARLEDRFAQLRHGFAKLLAVNLVFLLASLSLFFLLLQLFPNAKWPAMALYIGYYVFYALIMLSFWGLAGYLFDIRQSKRLFGLIGAGMVVAMIISGFSIRPLVNLVGASNLLLVAVAGVGVCLGLMLYTMRAYNSPAAAEKGPPARVKHRSEPKKDYLKLLKNRYVALMVILTVLNLVAYYFLDNIFYDGVYHRFPDSEDLAAFLGEFLAVASLLNLASRSFLSGKLVSRYGLTVSLLALPVALTVGVGLIVLAGAFLGAIGLIFWLIITARLLFRVVGDSIDKPAFSIFYQAMPSRQRLRVQTLIISIVEPVAGGLAGVVLLLLPFDLLQLSYTLLVILIAWLAVVIFLSREYVSTLLNALTSDKINLKDISLSIVDGSSLAILQNALKSHYEHVAIFALRMLEENNHPQLARFLREALSHPGPEVRRHALQRIEVLGLTSTLRAVRLRLRFETSTPVQAVALQTLAALGQTDELDEVAPYLDSNVPELKQGALVGLLRSGGIEGILLAGERFIKLVESPRVADRKMAARTLGEVGLSNFYRPLLKLLRDAQPAVRKEALTAAGKLRNPRLWPAVMENVAAPATRSRAISALVGGGESALPLLAGAFSQPDTPRETLSRIARICGRIGGDEAVNVLLRQIDYPDDNVRTSIFSALSACRYQAAGPQIGTIQQKIQAELENAAWLIAAQSDLGDDESLSLAYRALADELAQSRSRIFLLLSFIYESQTVLNVRDSLEHTSKEQRAYALEVLDNLFSRQKLESQTLAAQSLKEMFIPLIDDSLPLEQRRERITKHFPQPELGREKRLEAVVQRSAAWISPWSKACALDWLARHQVVEAEPTIITALDASDWFIREAALSALHTLDCQKYQPRLEAMKEDPSRQVSILAVTLQAKNGAETMLSTFEKVLLLKSVSIFAETPEDVLVEVAAALKEIEAAPGEVVVRQGDVDRSMYIIVSGHMQIEIEGEIVAHLKDKDIFGELSVLDAEPRSATVSAVAESRLFRLDYEAFYDLMADHVEVAYGVIQVLTRRIRAMQADDKPDYSIQEEKPPSKKDVLLDGIFDRLEEG